MNKYFYIIIVLLTNTSLFSQYYTIYSQSKFWDNINKIELSEKEFTFHQKPIYTNESLKFTLEITKIDSIKYQPPVPGYNQPRICYWTCGLATVGGLVAFSQPAKFDECDNFIDCIFTRIDEFGDRTDSIKRTAEIGLLVGLVFWGVHEYRSNKIEVESILSDLHDKSVDERMIIIEKLVLGYNLRIKKEKRDATEFFLY